MTLNINTIDLFNCIQTAVVKFSNPFRGTNSSIHTVFTILHGLLGKCVVKCWLLQQLSNTNMYIYLKVDIREGKPQNVCIIPLKGNVMYKF